MGLPHLATIMKGTGTTSALRARARASSARARMDGESFRWTHSPMGLVQRVSLLSCGAKHRQRGTGNGRTCEANSKQSLGRRWVATSNSCAPAVRSKANTAARWAEPTAVDAAGRASRALGCVGRDVAWCHRPLPGVD